MLPPANRLRKKKDIERVFANRKSCKSGLLVCKTAPSDMDAARFCFVVSKHVSNKATVRNLLKRRLREAVAALLPGVVKSCDCVLIACPGLQAKEYGEIRGLVRKILLLAGIYSEVTPALVRRTDV
jgi:ribonuclease P protein component